MYKRQTEPSHQEEPTAPPDDQKQENQQENHYSQINHTETLLQGSSDNISKPLLDQEICNYITIDQDTKVSYLPLSTTLTLKQKRHMYYFPMDFGELTIDGLIDKGALTSAISEADLNKIKLLSSDAILETGSAPNFQIMVANGH